jgi:RHS repeat-associated protein
MSPLRTISDQLAIHSRTPALVVFDPRGLAVRGIGYYRREAGATAQARINAQWHNAAGHPVAQWDPRQFAHFEAGRSETPNQSTVFSLSGQPLAQRSVDAGWKVTLSDSLGLPRKGWDGRGCTSMQYDDLRRVIAVVEQSTQGQARISQRLAYAEVTPASAALNLCGAVCRHDDDAGSQLAEAISITGLPKRTSRRYLAAPDLPDWPADTSARDALLEPDHVYASQSHHDASGALLHAVDAMGNSQHSAYDRAGQLRSHYLRTAAGDEKPLLVAIDFDAAGRSVSHDAGNGVVRRSEYSRMTEQLSRLHSVRSDGTVLQDLSYDYDPVGNIESIHDASQPTRHFANQRTVPVNRYSYDSFSQLISATGRESATVRSSTSKLPAFLPSLSDVNQLINYTQSFQYDDAGNLLELRHINGQHNHTQRMTVSLFSNRSLAEQEGKRPDQKQVTTAFDDNGNLCRLHPGEALEWDLRNQLSKVTSVRRASADDDYERYLYDASGSRVRKIASAKVRQGNCSLDVRYLPGLEIRTSSRNGEQLHVVVAQAGPCDVRFLHWQEGKPDELTNDRMRYSLGNQLGSCTLEVDDDAQLLSREEYYPFGGTACWAGRSALEARYKTIRYSGKERDASGLYYYGKRYYAPWLAHWINPDPAGASDGLNLYCMVANNPITFIDQQGLKRGKYQLDGETDQAYHSRKFRLDKIVSQRADRFLQSIDIINLTIDTETAALRNSSDGKALASAVVSKILLQVVSATVSTAAGMAAGAGALAFAAPTGPAAPVIAWGVGTVTSKGVQAAIEHGGTKIGIYKTLNMRSGSFSVSNLANKADNREGSTDGQVAAKLKGYGKAALLVDSKTKKVDGHKLEKVTEEVGKALVSAFVPGGKLIKHLPDLARTGHQAARAAQGGKSVEKTDRMIIDVMTTAEELMYQLEDVNKANWRGDDYPVHITGMGASRGPSLQSMATKLNKTLDRLEGFASIVDPGFAQREGYHARRATVAHGTGPRL